MLKHIKHCSRGGERMTNTELLKKVIRDSGIKVGRLLVLTNIKSYATFKGRMNNETEFTASEIQALSEALQLTVEQREQIFFAGNV